MYLKNVYQSIAPTAFIVENNGKAKLKIAKIKIIDLVMLSFLIFLSAMMFKSNTAETPLTIPAITKTDCISPIYKGKE